MRGSTPAMCLVALTIATTACRQVDEVQPATARTPISAPAHPRDERRPVWLASESSVFEHVQRTFEEAGYPSVRTAVMQVSEDAPLPSYRSADRTLLVPPFTDGVERMRARIAKLSATHFAGTFTFIDAFDSGPSALTAYQAFLTIAIAHELWHHVQIVRKDSHAHGPADIYDLEVEAIEAEQAFLAREITKGQVPAEWRDHYRRAVLAVKDSIPARTFTALPEDEKALRVAFAEAYLTVGHGSEIAGSGPNVEIDAAAVVYAGYTRKRMSLLVKGARSLEAIGSPAAR